MGLPDLCDNPCGPLSVIPIHKRPDLIESCARLINDEWPRSLGARMAQLCNSSESPPTNLVLLKSDSFVLAHIKITPVPWDASACFLESVVVTKECRGQGLGTYLMRQAEQYCSQRLQMSIIYLSTVDQVRFYGKLGYVECEPISIYGKVNFKRPTATTRKHYMKKTLKNDPDEDNAKGR
ncbi:N-alpha-acetyltransferase 80 isoform X2 [Phlebotomus argentipes]|uniref:N-alpha-acetyltransferase 80 isoform X2 n=1 Tax=Phlebotomus argentipes TaxID=94469 RepID=UPI002893118A|nr:N-alpha-acetyltransferase 80 isoform X2 [Phlebotomus argentipes]